MATAGLGLGPFSGGPEDFSWLVEAFFCIWRSLAYWALSCWVLSSSSPPDEDTVGCFFGRTTGWGSLLTGSTLEGADLGERSDTLETVLLGVVTVMVTLLHSDLEDGDCGSWMIWRCWTL